MKAHLKSVGQTDTWITPKYITDALGKFDLDPCAHTEMPWQHAEKCYTIHDDGLSQKWEGRVWLNPPYNQYRINHWLQKMSVHKNGIMLINAACETKRFYKYVYPEATGILMMNHRPFFCLHDGKKGKYGSGQTICLISYDEENLQSLLQSKLGVVLKPIGNYQLEVDSHKLF